MSANGNAPAGGGTTAYVTRFDGVRVAATDYRAVWPCSPADGHGRHDAAGSRRR
jgi:hypothetical protein